MRGVKHTQKYWFALGYYHKRINEIQVPSEAMIGAYYEHFNVDILKEYELGIESAEKDINSGI